MVACALLWLACLSGQAQEVIARPFPFFYQLFSNEITCVQQDGEGYVWIGTTDGVARYDGHRLVTFRNGFDSPTRLSSNRVNCLADTPRHLWIGTNHGLTLYDKQTCTMRPLSDLAHSKSSDKELLATQGISSIATDGGTVWAATGGTVMRCTYDASQVKAYQLDPQRSVSVSQIYIDRQHRVWASCYGGLYLYDKRKDTFHKYPPLGQHDSPFTLCQDRDGHFWLGTWGEGLWRFYPDQTTSTSCYERQSVKVGATAEEDPDAFCIVQDDVLGYLWVLSYKELHTFRCDGGRLVPVATDSGIDPHMMFTMIAKDREGSLWLGSYDMGYHIFFNRSGIDGHPMPQLKQRLGWDANLVGLVFDDDVVWASQDRYGLLLYDTQSHALADHHQRLGEVSQMKKSAKGGVWLQRRYEERLVRAVRKGMEITYPTEILLSKAVANPGHILDFAEDAAGNLWIVTSNNLFVWQDGAEPKVYVGSGLPRFSAITSDGKGGVWCFAGDKAYTLTLQGSSVTVAANTTLPSMAQGESIRKSCADGKARLWVATSLGRILCSDVEGRTFTDTRLGTPLADAPVLQMVQGKGGMWMVTGKRIALCSPDGKLVKMWHAGEGNVMVEAFRQNAVSSDGHGGLLAGGHGGFIHIQTDKASTDDKTSTGDRIVVTDVEADGRSIIFSASDSINTTTTATLQPGDRNVRIFFSALTYSLRPQAIISYKLEGVDKDWTVATDNAFSAFYNELPAGKHRFLVRCQKPDGQWGEAQETLVLTQRPVFYKSTLAYIIYMMLSVALVGLCYAQRHRLASVVSRLKTMRQMYAGKAKLSVVGESVDAKASLASADKEFTQGVIATIRQHLQESDFGTDRLAEALSMSRTTLYRRVTSATGVAPADLIRRVQFERACELLEEQGKNISEIAYAVGFANPKYFAKCFKEEFGVTPSDYQKRHKSVQDDAGKA